MSQICQYLNWVYTQQYNKGLKHCAYLCWEMPFSIEGWLIPSKQYINTDFFYTFVASFAQTHNLLTKLQLLKLPGILTSLIPLYFNCRTLFVKDEQLLVHPCNYIHNTINILLKYLNTAITLYAYLMCGHTSKKNRFFFFIVRNKVSNYFVFYIYSLSQSL